MNGTLYNLGGNYPLMYIFAYFYDPPPINYDLLPEEGYPLRETSATVFVTFPANYSGRFKVFAVDIYGNWAENDSVAPHIVNVYLKSLRPDYYKDVKISVFAEDPNGVAKAILSYNNGTKWYNVSMSKNKATGALEGHIMKQMPNPSITYKVYVEDYLGNVRESDTYKYKVEDNASPSIRITAPTNGSTLTGIVNITWEASDNESGLKSFDIYLNGSLKDTLYASSLESFVYSISNLTNGTYTVLIVAKDYANNNASDSIWFTYYITAEQPEQPEQPEGPSQPELPLFVLTPYLIGGVAAVIIVIVLVVLLKRRKSKV